MSGLLLWYFEGAHVSAGECGEGGSQLHRAGERELAKLPERFFRTAVENPSGPAFQVRLRRNPRHNPAMQHSEVLREAQRRS